MPTPTKPSFEPIRTGDNTLVLIQTRIKETFEAFLNYISPTFVVVSFVANGVDGTTGGLHFVQLPANRNLDGSIRRQALKGAKLVAALAITGGSSVVDQQTAFEPVLSLPGQIKQVSTANLTTTVFAFLLTQPTLK